MVAGLVMDFHSSGTVLGPGWGRAGKKKPRPAGLLAYLAWGWGLEVELALYQGGHVGGVVADPLAVVLVDHGGRGMPHLFGDPIQRHHPAGEHLAGEGVPGMVRPSVTYLCCFQVRIPPAVAQIIGGRIAPIGMRVMEHEPHVLLAHRAVVPIGDLDLHRWHFFRSLRLRT